MTSSHTCSIFQSFYKTWLLNFPITAVYEVGKVDEKDFLRPPAAWDVWFATCSLAVRRSRSASHLLAFDLAPFWPTERHLLVNIASSENTRNSSKDLVKSILVSILRMTKKLEYFGKKKKLIDFSLESTDKLQFHDCFQIWKTSILLSVTVS